MNNSKRVHWLRETHFLSYKLPLSPKIYKEINNPNYQLTESIPDSSILSQINCPIKQVKLISSSPVRPFLTLFDQLWSYCGQR